MNAPVITLLAATVLLATPVAQADLPGSLQNLLEKLSPGDWGIEPDLLEYRIIGVCGDATREICQLACDIYRLVPGLPESLIDCVPWA